MPFEISDIKSIRKKLGLTQSELAAISGVSQSLIAKIEAGNIDPTYTKAQKILEALKNLGKQKEIPIEKIMNSKVIAVHPNDTISNVVSKMKRYEISQVPVIRENKCVGYVSESTLLDALVKNKAHAKVADIMKESPPVVSKVTSTNAVSQLLPFFSMVLISEKGKIVGVVTKSDIIRKMFK